MVTLIMILSTSSKKELPSAHRLFYIAIGFYSNPFFPEITHVFCFFCCIHLIAVVYLNFSI